MKSQLDKDGIETFLNNRLETAYREYSKVKSLTLSKLCSNLVENINCELPKTCPSVDGFKYVVQATVQDNYGQGSLVGGKCEWNCLTDDFVKVALELEKVSLTVVVFFVSIDDSDSEEDEAEAEN